MAGYRGQLQGYELAVIGISERVIRERFSTFLSLTGHELVRCMEPITNDPLAHVSKEILKCMMHDSSICDICHSVYASELGAIHNSGIPESLVTYLVVFWAPTPNTILGGDSHDGYAYGALLPRGEP